MEVGFRVDYQFTANGRAGDALPTIYANLSVANIEFYDGLASLSHSGNVVELVDVGDGIAVYLQREGIGLVEN